VFIEGRLKLDKWTTNEGQSRQKLSVIVEGFQFIGGKPQGQTQRQKPQEEETMFPDEQGDYVPPADDIPF
jgi:single-stranded DNA-binding protein